MTLLELLKFSNQLNQVGYLGGGPFLILGQAFTNDNTPTPVVLDGSTGSLLLPDTCALQVNLRVTGLSAANDMMTYQQYWAVSQTAGTISVLNAIGVPTLYQDTGALTWSVALSDNSPYLDVVVTGGVADTIIWTSVMDIVSVVNPI